MLFQEPRMGGFRLRHLRQPRVQRVVQRVRKGHRPRVREDKPGSCSATVG